MPTKTIYVSAADLPLLERAAELGGGLSSAVCTALRHFIHLREADMLGYQPVEITVSDGEVRRCKRFTGRRLAGVTPPDPEAGRVTRYIVYLTQRGQYAVHMRTGPDWSALASTDEEFWENPANSSADWYRGRSTLEVYPDLDALAPSIPGHVMDAVRRALDTPHVEELDI